MANPARFLDLLDPADRESAMQLGQPRRVTSGSYVFLTGDDPKSFVLIVSGWVKLVTRSADGNEALLGFRQAGDVVGEMGAIDGRPRSADVIAVHDVVLRVGSARALRDFLDADPRRWRAMCLLFNDRLRESDLGRTELAALSSSARIAARLVHLSEAYGRQAGSDTVIRLPITQDELANWTGLSRPTVARAMAELRSLGCVETSRRRIVVTDLARLSALT